MSYHPRIVPWRTPQDLENLKSLLFPLPSPSTITSAPPPPTSPSHLQALRTIRTWTTRGRLPHSIEATAHLISATLHDTSSTSSSNLPSRLCYSAAICRFVNGLLDPAQQSQFALPMHALAKQLNLPAAFVEVRHAATHEALPSLVVLRGMTARALEWLWENYWSGVGVAAEADVGMAAWADRARDALRQWRRLRRDNPSIAVDGNGAAGRVVKECVAICKHPGGADALVHVLLEEKALVPAGKLKSPLMPGAILLWSPLLEMLDSAASSTGGGGGGFAMHLVSAMLDVLKSYPPSPVTQLLHASSSPVAVAVPQPHRHTPELCEAILAWLQYFTSADAKVKFGKNGSVELDGVARQCVLSPTEWTIRLLGHLLNEHCALKERYGAIVDIAASQVELVCPTDTGVASKKRKLPKTDDEPSAARRSIHTVEKELDEFEARFEAFQKARQCRKQSRKASLSRDARSMPEGHKEDRLGGEAIGGWKKWSGEWTPRPIGVL